MVIRPRFIRMRRRVTAYQPTNFKIFYVTRFGHWFVSFFSRHYSGLLILNQLCASTGEIEQYSKCGPHSNETLYLTNKTTKGWPNWSCHDREPPLCFALPPTMFFGETKEPGPFLQSPSHPLGTWNVINRFFFKNTSANSAKDHFVYKLKKNLVKLSCE